MLKSRPVPVVFSMFLLMALILAVMAKFASRYASVVVEWTTASELNTAGFNVYRGLSAQQSGSPLNPQMIPPSSDALAGDTYQYVDDKVLPGTTYFYYVEEVDQTGAMTRYGPIEIHARGGGIVEGWSALFVACIGLVGLIGWYIKEGQRGQ